MMSVVLPLSLERAPRAEEPAESESGGSGGAGGGAIAMTVVVVGGVTASMVTPRSSESVAVSAESVMKARSSASLLSKAMTACTRTLAAEKRSEASNSCLAAFNRGVTDECFDSCVAAANGAEWHPGARPRDVYDQRGRPCTSAQNWDHCRAGYEAAVEQTRALFFAPEPEPEPEPESPLDSLMKMNPFAKKD